MTRAYCLTCNEQVDVSDDGRCPRGHDVSAEDLGPQPWIGRALSAVGKRPPGPAGPQPEGDDPAEDAGAAPSADEPTTAEGEPDELAALLADLDDGGPADLMTDDDGSPTRDIASDDVSDTPVEQADDTPSELAALAEELALRADIDSEDDAGDDTLGALDDAISAWDESDEAIVAPSEPIPDDAEGAAEPTREEPGPEEPAFEEATLTEGAIPPPPQPGTEPSAAPPPPPPSVDDLFAGDESADLPPPTEPPVQEASAPDEPPPAEEPPSEATRAVDLTNFTASGKRIDTSSTPRKRGLFGRGR